MYVNKKKKSNEIIQKQNNNNNHTAQPNRPAQWLCRTLFICKPHFSELYLYTYNMYGLLDCGVQRHRNHVQMEN